MGRRLEEAGACEMGQACARWADSHDVSTMHVVTFSGVTSGGMVTSGTTCWTCGRSECQV